MGPGNQKNPPLAEALIRGRSEKMAEEQAGGLTPKGPRVLVFSLLRMYLLPRTMSIQFCGLVPAAKLNLPVFSISRRNHCYSQIMKTVFCWRKYSELIKIENRITGDPAPPESIFVIENYNQHVVSVSFFHVYPGIKSYSFHQRTSGLINPNTCSYTKCQSSINFSVSMTSF